jgi:hypothetical protein
MAQPHSAQRIAVAIASTGAAKRVKTSPDAVSIIDIHAFEGRVAEMSDGKQRTNVENKLTDALSEIHLFYDKLAEMLAPYLRMTTKVDPITRG